MSYTVGIDVGGTFTDCVVVDARGGVTLAKASSTPPNFEDGVLDALQLAGKTLVLPVEELLAQARIFHGCTVGTNALVEGRTAKVGLLVTAGHKEPVYIMKGGGRLRGLSPEYVAAISQHGKPEPLVDRHLVSQVHERITVDGEVLVELEATQVREAIQELLEAGAESFAISFLWSTVNDSHEVAVQQIVQELAPNAFVSRASAVVPRIGEYERTIGAVINSLVGPVMKTYLGALREQLRTAGYTNELGIMSCWGGLIDSVTAERFPLLTIGSGPAAGVVAAHILSDAASSDASDDVITTDMGGTTFDVGLVINGRPVMRTTSKHGQYEYAVPTLDVRSIGAGGGSIIHYDEALGTLRVGPHSAGARPGPAAFLRGGTQATVTDADLVLGYLDPNSFLGGSMQLGLDAARSAIELAGKPLGFSVEETAASAARIIDSQMADALRLISVGQGRDPRQFVLYAYGGNGPVHAPALARSLGVSRIVVPLGDLASGWSAFGVAAAEAVIIEEMGLPMQHPFDHHVLESVWSSLEEKALDRLFLQGVAASSVNMERLAEIKYATQVNQVRVKAPFAHCDEESVNLLVGAFEQEYDRLYGEGAGYPAAGFALTSVAVRASAQLSSVALVDRSEAKLDSARKEDRPVIWYELGPEQVLTSIFDGTRVDPGMTFVGPSVIDFPVTTVVIRPGQEATVDIKGNIVIQLEGCEQ